MTTTDHDTAEVTADVDGHHDERGSFVVTVKTPAGFYKTFRVTDATRVETLTRKAVELVLVRMVKSSRSCPLARRRDGQPAATVAGTRCRRRDRETGSPTPRLAAPSHG